MPKFVKGQSGNPKGAPKRDWTWSGELAKAAEEVVNGTSIKEAMAKSMIKESLKGNVNAFNAIANRMDGMPEQPVKHDGTIDGNINISFHESLKQIND